VKLKAEWRRIQARLDWMFWHTNPEPVELLISCTLTCFGLWLLAPWLDTFNSTPSFTAMAATGLPEWLWGLGIALLGVSQLTGLLLWKQWRRQVAMLIGVFLLYLAALFALSNFPAPNDALFIPLAIGSFWIYVRLRCYRRL
jgi:hypothetical protein